jgi:hypothetical protein
MNDRQTQRGYIHFTQRDSGVIVRDEVVKNTITTAGKEFLVAFLMASTPAAPFMNFLQLGTNGSSIAAAIAAGATSVESNLNILGSATTGSIVLNPSTPGNTNSTTETVTVSAVSGSGPYTYTISATTYLHDAGEPVVMEALVTDTALGTALGSSATVATQSSSAKTFTDAVTFTTTTNVVVYEAGMFSASAGSGTDTMYTHATFAPYNLTSTSDLTAQWSIEYL